MRLKLPNQTIVAIFCVLLYSCQKNDAFIAPNDPSLRIFPTEIAIPLGGNAYVTEPVVGGTETIVANGLTNWSSPNAITSTFFRLGKTGLLSVSVKAAVPSGSGVSTLNVTIDGRSFKVDISGQAYKTYQVGTVDISKIGYVKIDLAGITRGSNPYFANVSDFLISGTATVSDVLFANNPATFSSARKGATVRLQYNLPAVNAEWFYNELTVPGNGERNGTYYMSNGFNGGDFGMQLNSGTDRKITFRVADNFSQRATIVKAGAGVANSTYSGSVSGSQSTLNYNWIAGTTYKFLTQGIPDGFGNTVFSAWFYATESAEWKFIASWKRPATSGYLKNVYSSLEGTNTENSYAVRKARYYNQWIRDNNGTWAEVTNADFNADAVATALQRFDFIGGVEYSSFYLKSNGFFPENLELKTNLTRSGTISSPDIDLNNLPR